MKRIGVSAGVRRVKVRRGSNSSPSERAARPEPFEVRMARIVRRTLAENGSALVFPPPRYNPISVHTIAASVKRLLRSGVDRNNICILVYWLQQHYADSCTPKLYKASDFADRFGQLWAAMKRDKLGRARRSGRFGDLRQSEIWRRFRQDVLFDEELRSVIRQWYNKVFGAAALDSQRLDWLLRVMGFDPVPDIML